MKKSKGSPLMTLTKAAEALGMTGANRGQRLLRFLQRFETQTGNKFLIRRGGVRQVRYLVTLSLLREKCPHLFDLRNEAVEELRERFDAFDKRFKELHDRDLMLAETIAKISCDVAFLGKQLERAGLL